ncbi:MAG: CDP-diacylglycerol--glycerol-3-phosphate 3-phosphatidyltransferase [Mollicutes bacterium]|nr:CDP-diacylglycerol--glycerol-3-phosphate 3-phosphatidyltransferase [Mollicutes bacterium]MDD7264320.1 CDP-diacylglycerol--glycerol-3-phosphate 3-phosphatidyltransferase [bacterium]MDY4980154.1 CDP-diacylglycerol--glycerol-3-phosphate 3-phosphatidyltransferase [Candidatus Onthovivens sp.]
MKQKINLPTKITISRIVLAFCLILSIFIMYLVDEFHPFISNANLYIGSSGAYVNYIMVIIFAVFVIASLTDFLDGYLARKNNQVTDLGKFLDPIADKMLVNSMLVFLSINFVSLNDHLRFPFFCVILMIIRDLVVDGLRFMAATKKVVISANIYGKLKTVFQMIALSIVLLNGFPFNLFDSNWIRYLHISDIFCYIATLISLISGVIYLTENIHMIIGGKNNE